MLKSPFAFTTRPEIKGNFGVVATTHWIATSAAMGVLERGGTFTIRRLAAGAAAAGVTVGVAAAVAAAIAVAAAVAAMPVRPDLQHPFAVPTKPGARP